MSWGWSIFIAVIFFIVGVLAAETWRDKGEL